MERATTITATGQSKPGLKPLLPPKPETPAKPLRVKPSSLKFPFSDDLRPWARPPEPPTIQNLYTSGDNSYDSDPDFGWSSSNASVTSGVVSLDSETETEGDSKVYESRRVHSQSVTCRKSVSILQSRESRDTLDSRQTGEDNKKVKARSQSWSRTFHIHIEPTQPQELQKQQQGQQIQQPLLLPQRQPLITQPQLPLTSQSKEPLPPPPPPSHQPLTPLSQLVYSHVDPLVSHNGPQHGPQHTYQLPPQLAPQPSCQAVVHHAPPPTQHAPSVSQKSFVVMQSAPIVIHPSEVTRTDIITWQRECSYHNAERALAHKVEELKKDIERLLKQQLYTNRKLNDTRHQISSLQTNKDKLYRERDKAQGTHITQYKEFKEIPKQKNNTMEKTSLGRKFEDHWKCFDNFHDKKILKEEVNTSQEGKTRLKEQAKAFKPTIKDLANENKTKVAHIAKADKVKGEIKPRVEGLEKTRKKASNKLTKLKAKRKKLEKRTDLWNGENKSLHTQIPELLRKPENISSLVSKLAAENSNVRYGNLSPCSTSDIGNTVGRNMSSATSEISVGPQRDDDNARSDTAERPPVAVEDAPGVQALTLPETEVDTDPERGAELPIQTAPEVKSPELPVEKEAPKVETRKTASEPPTEGPSAEAAKSSDVVALVALIQRGRVIEYQTVISVVGFHQSTGSNVSMGFKAPETNHFNHTQSQIGKRIVWTMLLVVQSMQPPRPSNGSLWQTGFVIATHHAECKRGQSNYSTSHTMSYITSHTRSYSAPAQSLHATREEGCASNSDFQPASRRSCVPQIRPITLCWPTRRSHDTDITKDDGDNCICGTDPPCKKGNGCRSTKTY